MFLEQLKLFRMPEPPAPMKTRHLLIGGRIVEYSVKTGVRRLTMAIDERGLRINLPPRVTQPEVEAFVREHAAWVLRKLDELTQTAQRRHLGVRDGVRLPLLGGEAEVRVLPGANRLRWVGDTLLLEARPDADLNALAVRALQRRALPHFQARLEDCCARLGRPVPPLSLSSAATRWGSCSRESGIRINWRLIHLPAELGDYVVAHEAAHLIEMNHSRRFWSIVERLHPGSKETRAELKRSAASLPIL